MDIRYQRAIKENICFIGVKEPDYCFIVQGESGNKYIVKITSNTFSCTCLDYTGNKPAHKCKHMYFLLRKVLLLTSGRAQSFPTSNCRMSYFSCYYNIIDRLKFFKEAYHVPMPVVKRLALDDADECPICLEKFGDKKDISYCKHSCGQNIHTKCNEVWLKTNKICVFCRHPWE